MSYQSFPWQQGDSRSFEKLLSLFLPVLKGKTFLDAGCNTGFFCGWAAFQGALRVRGIDRNAACVEQARLWFPECDFTCMSWDDLGNEQYDVILCLSALHYAANQEALLHLLMSRLRPDGLLVLEMGLAPGEETAFVEVQRSIDCRLFPTRSMAAKMMEGYVSKYIGNSVPQAGDPLPRVVYHLTHARPVVLLFMDDHYSGKSSVARRMIRPDIPVVSGDSVLQRVHNGDVDVSPALRNAVRRCAVAGHLNCAWAAQTVCESGLLEELVALYIGSAGCGDWVLDGAIPADYRDALAALLERAGYFVGRVGLSSAGTHWKTQRPPTGRYKEYLALLEARAAIDEDAYLAANPDVAAAVARGDLPGARYHYLHFGRREKRPLAPQPPDTAKKDV